MRPVSRLFPTVIVTPPLRLRADLASLLVLLAGDLDRPVLGLETDVRVERLDELALGTFHPQRVAVDLDVNALRDLHRQPTDTTHLLITRHRRGLPRPDPFSRPGARS